MIRLQGPRSAGGGLKRAKKVNMHITGKNVVEFLKKLDSYETNAQKLLRGI